MSQSGDILLSVFAWWHLLSVKTFFIFISKTTRIIVTKVWSVASNRAREHREPNPGTVNFW